MTEFRKDCEKRSPSGLIVSDKALPLSHSPRYRGFTRMDGKAGIGRKKVKEIEGMSGC